MIVNEESGSSKDITSELSLHILAAPRDTLYWVTMFLSVLDGNAANITINVYDHTAMADTLIYTTGVVAKPVAGDLIFIKTLAQPIYISSGRSIEIKVLSSNASDTGVSFVSSIADPYNNGVVPLIDDVSASPAPTTTVFGIGAGKATADAYNGMLVAIEDADDNNVEVRRIVSWSVARVITLNRALSFTPAPLDRVVILADSYGDVNIDYIRDIAAALQGDFLKVDTASVGGETPAEAPSNWSDMGINTDGEVTTTIKNNEQYGPLNT